MLNARFERFGEWEVTQSDRDQIIDLLAEAFPVDFEGKSYFNQPPYARLVARRDARIVAQLSLFLRRVTVADMALDIVGFGDVAVDAGVRGQGLGLDLVAEALNWARTFPARFALLEGDSGIYARNGFSPCCTRVRHLTTAPEPAVDIAIDVPVLGYSLDGSIWPVGLLDLNGPRF